MNDSDEKSLRDARILILIPVFNDWKALEMLLGNLDSALQGGGTPVEVLVVDDASIDSYAFSKFTVPPLTAIEKVSLLELKRNLGHQRAIALGLAYVEANVDCQAVLVMDGDGEDDPKDVPRLIEKCAAEGFRKVVFARRSKRSEGLLFRFFYNVYKSFYRLLTGQEMRVGNFSIIPREILSRLVVVSEVWNHYAVGVLKARVPYAEVNTRRGVRLSGRPQMNFISLVTHGLSAISVYGDIVGVRLLIATSILILLSIIGILTALTIKFTTTLAIPGWTTYVVALFLIILMQGVILSLFFIFIVLSGRNNASFLPQRDYHYFILRARDIFIKHDELFLHRV